MSPSLNERIALACRLNGEFPLQALYDRPALRVGEPSSIPPKCFQTAESHLFSRTHHATLIQLRERNSELHFLLFDANRRDRYMAERWSDHPIGNLYRRARFGVMRADIFRYCVIFDQGGFYLDINKLILQPLIQFVRHTSRGVISFESTWCQLPAAPRAADRLLHPDRYALQWCFGFAPNHPLLAMMIENICHYAQAYEGQSFANPSEAIRSFTGPGLFTHTVRSYFEQNADPTLVQAGIDFNGELRYPTEREVMYLRQPHYKTRRDEPILAADQAG